MIASRSKAAAVAALLWSLPAHAQTPPVYNMPTVVVTATGRPEEVSRIAGTIQVIPQERIARSTAKSVTDLLAENAVGFMSEWTAGQTSITTCLCSTSISMTTDASASSTGC